MEASLSLSTTWWDNTNFLDSSRWQRVRSRWTGCGGKRKWRTREGSVVETEGAGVVKAVGAGTIPWKEKVVASNRASAARPFDTTFSVLTSTLAVRYGAYFVEECVGSLRFGHMPRTTWLLKEGWDCNLFLKHLLTRRSLESKGWILGCPSRS